jgi:hypothetical protein
MKTARMVKTLEEALTPEPLLFGLTIRNIPTVNLRGQYAHDRRMILDGGLNDEGLHAWRFAQREVTVTYADPESYFTTLLRTTIVGIECTIESSAWEELLFSNRLTEQLRHSVRNPSSIARSLPEAYYNRIPQLVNVNAPLKSYNGKLWNTVQQFYREIRNPIFHSYQLSDVKAESLRNTFGMFDDIFKWLDSWADPNRVHKILASTMFHRSKA